MPERPSLPEFEWEARAFIGIGLNGKISDSARHLSGCDGNYPSWLRLITPRLHGPCLVGRLLLLAPTPDSGLRARDWDQPVCRAGVVLDSISGSPSSLFLVEQMVSFPSLALSRRS